MVSQRNRLLANPLVAKKLEEAEKTVRVKRNLNSQEGIRKVLESEGIKQIMDDILMQSPITPQQKEYIKLVFYSDWSSSTAFERVKGRKPDDKYESEKYRKSIMNSPAVKDFLEVMRLFYIRALPVAAVKEVELLLNPNTKDGVKMEAIKDIQDRAGMGPDQKTGQLPVNVVINIPMQQNTQVNTEGGVE